MLLCQALKVTRWDLQPPWARLARVVHTWCSVPIWWQSGETGHRKEACQEQESLHGGSDFISCLEDSENLAKYWRHTFSYLLRVWSRAKGQKVRCQRSTAGKAFTSIWGQPETRKVFGEENVFVAAFLKFLAFSHGQGCSSRVGRNF